jgi:hypothetical protein
MNAHMTYQYMAIELQGMKRDAQKVLQYIFSDPGLNHIIVQHPTTDYSSFHYF